MTRPKPAPKRPVGRPRLPGTRTVLVSTRLSEAEAERCRQIAGAGGETFSAWVRAAILAQAERDLCRQCGEASAKRVGHCPCCGRDGVERVEVEVGGVPTELCAACAIEAAADR